MTTNLPPIGLVGLAQAGKDTTAGFLADFGYQRVAFADALKSAALAIDPYVQADSPIYSTPLLIRLSSLLEHHGGDWEPVKRSPEVRRFLQALGVSVRDHVSEDAWVDAAHRTAHEIRVLGSEPVFTDVRFENEVEYVRSIGGVIVRVDRPGHSGLAGPAGQHASEALAQTVEPDFILTNGGDLTYLHMQVVLLIMLLPGGFENV